MVDKIVKFKNDDEYLLLDEAMLEGKKYYLGIKVEEDNEPTSVYLFFEEIEKDKKIILNPVWNEEMKGLLLTAFTVNFMEMNPKDEESERNEKTR